jgi:hypothetical protein
MACDVTERDNVQRNKLLPTFRSGVPSFRLQFCNLVLRFKGEDSGGNFLCTVRNIYQSTRHNVAEHNALHRNELCQLLRILSPPPRNQNGEICVITEQLTDHKRPIKVKLCYRAVKSSELLGSWTLSIDRNSKYINSKII